MFCTCHVTIVYFYSLVFFRYHDMSNVVDFLVLAQHYDIARRRQWKPGDLFRAVVRDRWWLGVIESKTPFEKEHPNSLFRCYAARYVT